jgi:hypothetical protein
MGTEFDDALTDLTGASAAPAAVPEPAPDLSAPEAPIAPATPEGNPFDQALADAVQQPAPEVARDMPEPGGAMEH